MPWTPNTDVSGVQPFVGYVDTTGDALRLIQAARRGVIPRITRRLNELERRSMIKSGAVFVFSVDESGIKRWTEGLSWSPSRIAGNFLIYREVIERSGGRSLQQKSDATDTQRGYSADSSGSFKPQGLIKKTITVKIDGSDHHLISYFTQADVQYGNLQRPTCRPDLMALDIPPELLQSTNFRYPPKIEAGPDGKLTQIRDTDELDNQSEGTMLPASPQPGTTGQIHRALGEDSSAFSHVGFPRSHDSADGFYQAHPGGEQFGTSYLSSPLQGQPELHPAVSAAMPGRSGNTHSQYTHDSDHRRPPHMTTLAWRSMNYLPTGSSAAGASADYHSPSPHSPTQFVSEQATQWEQQTPMPPSRSRANFSLSMDQDDNGRHASHMSWPMDTQMLSGHPMASVQAVPTSPTADLSTGRREHTRTRSSPSVWHWDQNGTLPSHYELPSLQHMPNLPQDPSSSASSFRIESQRYQPRGPGNAGRL